jgi:putative hydrolase of the HAD superfamily
VAPSSPHEVNPRRFGAVPAASIFDLFGTLVPSASMEKRDAISHELAEILGVDRQAFAEIVRSTFDERMRGEIGDLRRTYTTLSERLGGAPDLDRADEAIARRLEFSHELLGVRDAEPVLSRLRHDCYLLGIVTDCSVETPEVWVATWLGGAVDAVSFSCVLGTRKPHERNYLAVTEELGVDASSCVHVGDGGSQELSGARALGMRPVLLSDPREHGNERPDEEIGWSGEVITSIADVLDLVG